MSGTNQTLEEITLHNYSETTIQSSDWMSPQSLPNLIIEDPYDVAQELSYHLMCIADTLKQVKEWDENPLDEIISAYPDSPIKTEVINLIKAALEK